jgi:hypothetical protein
MAYPLLLKKSDDDEPASWQTDDGDSISIK